jgi:hypothetical protein
MDHASPYATGTGFIVSGFGPIGQGLERQDLPSAIAWVESGVVKAEVVVAGGSAQLPCGKAYTDGYIGAPFQSR